MCIRDSGQTPAHGAAILGQLDILKRLHELGADVLTPVDDRLMVRVRVRVRVRVSLPNPNPNPNPNPTPTPNPNPNTNPNPNQAPLDYALYFRQIPCADYLRSLGGEGYLSKKELAEAEFVGAKLLKLISIQSLARGGAVRKQVLAIRQTKYAEKHQGDQAGLDLGLVAEASKQGDASK